MFFKKNIIILILLAYFLLLIKSVLPEIEYLLNKNYFAKYLCIYKDEPENDCQGKCHLKKQIQNANLNDQNSGQKKNTAPTHKSKSEIQIEALSRHYAADHIAQLNKELFSLVKAQLLEAIIMEIPLPPPKPVC